MIILNVKLPCKDASFHIPIQAWYRNWEKSCLSHCYLETCKRVIGKQSRPRSDARVASDQHLHCLLTGYSTKNRMKATENRLDTSRMINGLIQHMTVEESTNTQWVTAIEGGRRFANETKRLFHNCHSLQRAVMIMQLLLYNSNSTI